MMSGITFVDGVDIYTEYGVYVTFGGWNNLIAWPSLKSYKSNDWQEEDGLEADLSSPQLDGQEGSVGFAIGGSVSDYDSFVGSLSDGAYHIFEDRKIGRTFKLRLVQGNNRDVDPRLGFAELRFANDFSPFDGFVRGTTLGASPVSESIAYTVDDNPLTNYGVRVLKGSLNEVEKTPQVKANLKRNIDTLTGVEYDPKTVTFKAKDVALQCLMRADTLTDLWRNWTCLLYDLVQPGERLLYVDAIGQEFPCCYKSCAVSEFYPDGKIWLAFTLTVTFLRDFRITSDPVLATEDNQVVLTETDENFVDLKPVKTIK